MKRKIAGEAGFRVVRGPKGRYLGDIWGRHTQFKTEISKASPEFPRNSNNQWKAPCFLRLPSP